MAPRKGRAKLRWNDISPEGDRGILKKVIKYGVGTSSPSNGNVTIHYTGKFLDGTVFDTTIGKEPFKFQLQKGSVIRMFDSAIPTMKKGEISDFKVEPKYAYGAEGLPPKIPPDAKLRFQVELIDWKAEDISKDKDGSILKTILNVGEAYSTPNLYAFVTVHIIGEYEGRIFDERDNLEFAIGEGSVKNVVVGIEAALQTFKKNEKSELLINSKYGFGSKGCPEMDIPPNADLKYTVLLKHFEKSKESWAISCMEKLEEAVFFKAKATNYFHDGNYSLAAKLYLKAKDYIAHDVGFDYAEEDERKELYAIVNLNLALCYLKTERFIECRDLCSEVVALEPRNIKAHYRRGQANMGLNNPELAKVDFESVLKLEPDNQFAARLVLTCEKLISSHRVREKVVYADMFEKFAKHDQEREDEKRKQQPDVMKTLGEWGKDEREREPTEFEKENPNILMLDGTGDFKNM